jgi:hypothetical protein
MNAIRNGFYSPTGCFAQDGKVLGLSHQKLDLRRVPKFLGVFYASSSGLGRGFFPLLMNWMMRLLWGGPLISP